MANIELAQNNGKQEMLPGWITPSVGTVQNFLRSQKLGLVATHHPVLHQKAEPIPVDAITSHDTRNLVDRLRRIADAQIEAGQTLVGLAATQIGIGRRAVLVNFSLENGQLDLSALTIMINPVITTDPESESKAVPEGCFSCGPVQAVTQRPTSTLVSWYGLDGRRQGKAFKFAGSVIAGHEIDHLMGVLAPDSRLAVRPDGVSSVDWADAEEVPEYGATVWPGGVWSRQCPPDQWAAMKRLDSWPGPKFRLANFVIPRSRAA